METYAGQTVRNRGNGSTGVLSTFTNLPTSADACGVGTTAESSIPRPGNSLLQSVDPEHLLRLRQFIKLR